MRAILLLGVLLVAACEELGKVCTLVGCGVPFAVNFEKASGWEAGNYTVEVVADGRASSCTVRLPFDGCTVAMGCDGQPTWRLNLSGCASPAQQHSLGGVTFTGEPASVAVTVSRDGQTIGNATFTPSYTVGRPNGPGCEPECRAAPAAKLTLP